MDTIGPDDVVAPPVVVAPFRLWPFPALRLAASAVGDPASQRVFARPFQAVPQRLRRWESRGRLVRDEEPALYLHEYTGDGVTVRGLVGALDLTVTSETTPAGRQTVFPHEGVHPDQVSQLADKMEKMQANPAPILLVHRGSPEGRAALARLVEEPPSSAFLDRAGQTHRIWPVRDSDLLEALDADLRTTNALIADGHHRYASYLRLRARHPGTAWDRGLAMLVDQSDTPLWLGAIHRFLSTHHLDDLAARLGSRGPRLTFTDREDALSRLSERTLVLHSKRRWATLTLAHGDLAVTELDNVLLPQLGVARHQVSYHHVAEQALQRAERGAGTAVLLPAPPFDAVVAAATRGELLPEKATSFQPKPSVGVLMRSLRDERGGP